MNVLSARANRLNGPPVSDRVDVERRVLAIGNAALAIFAGALLGALLAGRDIPAAVDDEGYLAYATFSTELLVSRFQDLSFAEWLLSEPLWLLINAMLALVMDEEMVVRSIIGASALAMFCSVFKLSRWNLLVCLAFVLFPTVLKNYVVHLRQGAAISVFLLFLAFWPRWVIGGTALAALVHTSMIPLLLLITIDQSRSLHSQLRRFSIAWSYALWVGFLAAVPFVLREVLQTLGDRRADDYAFAMEGAATGLGFVLWAVVLAVLLVWRPATGSDRWRYGVAMLSMYLAWYFFLDVGGRLIDSGLVFVWLAGGALRGIGSKLFWGVWMIAGALSWVVYLGQPVFLGF